MEGSIVNRPLQARVLGRSAQPPKEGTMSEHVHVRVGHGLAVTEDGDLIEQYRCKCGQTWTHVHRADEGHPER
jgi:hypothetical protein